MANNLLIVESPAKAKTIKKYLGSSYKVVASMGHVRDLPKSQMGVDIDNNFTPKYIPIRGKAELIRGLKKDAKAADRVLLATDPDREGEAISWHLAEMLGVDDKKNVRVTFNEITKSAVKEGVKHARPIDMSLVDAQQARRVLDRIVGYKISPFLWKKIRKGLSAGRVQSVATRLIVDREDEITAFIPEEYWSLDARLAAGGKGKPFTAKFYGDSSGKRQLTSEAETNEVLAAVKDAAFTVLKIKTGTRQKSPAPPFITSTLQQEASRRLNYPSRKTMQIAQQLYEGVDIKGHGSIGLITYMRTDSLRVSAEALRDARTYIAGAYGDNYMPPKERYFRGRKNAQDAHEAIRPSIPGLTPQDARGSLTNDQYRLYTLIWQRFIASQMAEAVYDTQSADIDAAGYVYKASGFSVKFPGFTALYEEMTDGDKEDNTALPKLSEGDALSLIELLPAQHFTQPPPRFTEATLIKALEENGIGRPSTYAPTISTILSREYVVKEGKSFRPTQLGVITNQLMKENFTDIVDVAFTAKMEDQLDGIEQGETGWVDVIKNFYGGFDNMMKSAEQRLGDVNIKVPDEVTDEICEHCGRNMVIKIGRFGKFLACPGYPECKNTKPIVQETGGVCPKCGGRILQKKSKNGKKYFGCEHNPTCGFMTWDEPAKRQCPKCGKDLLRKTRWARDIYCSNDECDFIEKAPGKRPSEKTASAMAEGGSKDASTVIASAAAKKAPAKAKSAATAKAKPAVKKPTGSKTASKKPAAKKSVSKKNAESDA